MSDSRRAPRPLAGLIDLLLPLRCAGCGASRTGWCTGCARELGGPRRVHRALPADPELPIFALGRYRGAARRAIVAYKVAGRRDLAEPFGRALATGLRDLLTWDARLNPDDPGPRPLRGEPPSARAVWHLVPAPSRAITSRRRGGAHMVRVARRAAADLAAHGLRARAADLLAIAPGARDSAGLDPVQRRRNLAGRVQLRGPSPPAGEPLLLVDDVVTTGATLAGCAGALAAAGRPATAALLLTATAG